MAKPSASERIDHILDAIREIEVNTADLDFEEFERDRFRQLGIERCLEIISEGSRHIPSELTAPHPEIPWRRIADIGNRIRHAYHVVDSAIVWEIVTADIKALKAALLGIRGAASPCKVVDRRMPLRAPLSTCPLGNSGARPAQAYTVQFARRNRPGL